MARKAEQGGASAGVQLVSEQGEAWLEAEQGAVGGWASRLG